MSMLKIVLVDKDRKDVAHVDVPADKIVEAACIIYHGRYFIYSGQEGPFFSKVRFMEVGAPVDITEYGGGFGTLEAIL